MKMNECHDVCHVKLFIIIDSMYFTTNLVNREKCVVKLYLFSIRLLTFKSFKTFQPADSENLTKSALPYRQKNNYN